MTKLLTVIVPSYNMEKYLPKCLGSLVVSDKALFERLEVLVVNDGSKDRTSEIAHEFEAKYPDVFSVIDKKNGNYGSCINVAISAASGWFVKILDADDTFDTSAFSEYLSKLGALSPDVDMVMNDYIRVDEEGKNVGHICYDLPLDVNVGPDDLIRKNCPMAMHAVAYRKELLHTIGYRQTEGISYTDTEWFFLPPARCRNVRYLNLPVYRYLVGRAGQTMEQRSFVKNRWMLLKMLDGMTEQYMGVRFRQDVSICYLECQIKRMLSILVSIYGSVSPLDEAVAFVCRFRELIRIIPSVATAAHGEVILASTPFRFHYMDYVLLHPFCTRFVLAGVRSYLRCAGYHWRRNSRPKNRS